jgi:hypothetical protein
MLVPDNKMYCGSLTFQDALGVTEPEKGTHQKPSNNAMLLRQVMYSMHVIALLILHCFSS